MTKQAKVAQNWLRSHTFSCFPDNCCELGFSITLWEPVHEFHHCWLISTVFVMRMCVKKVPSPTHLFSYNSQMNTKCRTTRACSLCPPPKSIGDPISRSGIECPTNFLHLVRPPRWQPSVLGFSERTAHPSTYPIAVSIDTYSCCCCYCCLRIHTLLDAPCTSFALLVRLMRLSCRYLVPNFTLQMTLLLVLQLPGGHTDSTAVDGGGARS